MVAPGFNTENLGSQLWESVKEKATGTFFGYMKALSVKLGITEATFDGVVTLGETTLEYAKDYATEKGVLEAASAGLGYAIGGPWGVVFGSALEASGSIYRRFQEANRLTLGEPGATFNRGEWVAIEGKTVFTSEPDNHQSELGRRRLKKDIKISMGFYIEDGVELNAVKVFNFATLKEEERSQTEVASLSPTESSQVESNDFMRKLRTKYFEEEPASVTGFSVPTDPGTEVIFDGHIYEIEKAHGHNVQIIDKWGQRKVVDLAELRRGRVFMNTSHNYGVSAPSFTPGENSSIFTGQYVWVSPREFAAKTSTRELAVVSHLTDGRRLIGFYALDGKMVDVAEASVQLVSDEYYETLAKIPVFNKFRSMAYGTGEGRVAPGVTHPFECIGATLTGEATSKSHVTPRGVVEYLGKRTAGGVDLPSSGDGGMAGRLDYAEELSRQIPGRPAYDERDDTAFRDDTAPPKSNNGLVAVGVVIGAALLLFNSVG